MFTLEKVKNLFVYFQKNKRNKYLCDIFKVNVLRISYVQEINAVGARLEAAKVDVIKYCVGTVVSISAIGLVRVLM